MRLDHLNFCRQIRAQQSRMIVSVDGNQTMALMEHYANLAETAQKFILPDGGYLLEDPDLRALDDNEPLRLPFPSIALEYVADESHIESDQTNAPKRVIFAREVGTHENPNTIAGITIGSVVFTKAYGVWIPYPEVQIDLFDYIDRTRKSEVSDRFLYHIRCTDAVLNDARIVKDYGAEIDVLLSFLNSLQCSNVAIDRSEPRKAKIRHQGRGVLPFDSYHVLTIAAPAGEYGESHGPHSHRSPREHVRRGHVRRLHSGRKVWVNAALVNAGKGGKVTKDYVIGAPQ